ncbi:phosphonoacetaldehyde hydrolase [Lactococcus termiticola]|uniref:Phosphonoacetaldehyde hydrolase n=1 Tax=Lactococcus termiticola TaxID=2169526 RepID=A0A2R5HIS2_9LACT|nr:phosphonoacetaldehyde hydrolase [Lactococcus termiticola]GBG96260.1 phosphonoacetaldehyde hydrolase [Lactococcus termiticola]
MKIEAVILDWAGTTVDYGCFSPVQAFVDAFESQGIGVTLEEVREPMGILKRDHIIAMLEMPRINSAFKELKGRDYNDEDVDQILEVFTDKLMSHLRLGTSLKPGTLEIAQLLREKGIKIGSTTGYTKAMLEPVAEAAARLGYTPDMAVTPEEVAGFGRPYPYMIFENLKRLEVMSTENVIKIGDTVADVLEAKHAGIKSFAVVEGSSVMALSEEEWETLSPDEQEQRSFAVKKVFLEAGADVVLQNLGELVAYL